MLCSAATIPHARAGQRTSREEGQSPGVKTKLPLHIVHTVLLPQPDSGKNLGMNSGSGTGFRSLRVYVTKPGRGWGVSLWQMDVYGWEAEASPVPS